MKKILLTLSLTLATLTLVACGQKDKQVTKAPDPSQMKKDIILQETTVPHQDIRLKFNDIKLATAQEDFKGGTNLEQLKSTFGEPAKHEQVPAGDVTLDFYSWKFDQVELNVHLFEDNAIVRTISNFRFEREQTITKSTIESLKKTQGDNKGDTFKSISEKLGQPDVMSQAISSEKEEIEAIWTSGLKTDTGATLRLYFENNHLVNVEQTGVTD